MSRINKSYSFVRCLHGCVNTVSLELLCPLSRIPAQTNNFMKNKMCAENLMSHSHALSSRCRFLWNLGWKSTPFLSHPDSCDKICCTSWMDITCQPIWKGHGLSVAEFFSLFKSKRDRGYQAKDIICPPDNRIWFQRKIAATRNVLFRQESVWMQHSWKCILLPFLVKPFSN